MNAKIIVEYFYLHASCNSPPGYIFLFQESMMKTNEGPCWETIYDYGYTYGMYRVQRLTVNTNL